MHNCKCLCLCAGSPTWWTRTSWTSCLKRNTPKYIKPSLLIPMGRTWAQSTSRVSTLVPLHGSSLWPSLPHSCPSPNFSSLVRVMQHVSNILGSRVFRKTVQLVPQYENEVITKIVRDSVARYNSIKPTIGISRTDSIAQYIEDGRYSEVNTFVLPRVCDHDFILQWAMRYTGCYRINWKSAGCCKKVKEATENCCFLHVTYDEHA